MAQDVGIAERLQLLFGKLAVLHFDLLQADNIRLLLLDEATQQLEAQTQRVDVPGNETHEVSDISQKTSAIL